MVKEVTEQTRYERLVDKALRQADNCRISLFSVSLGAWPSSLTHTPRSKGKFQSLESEAKAMGGGDTTQTPDMVGAETGHGFSPSSVLSVALTEK